MMRQSSAFLPGSSIARSSGSNRPFRPNSLESLVESLNNYVSWLFYPLFVFPSKQKFFLDRRFDDDRRVQQAAGDAKQDAVLRLLSSTLTDNVEQVISRIVMNNIQGHVVPAIAEVTTSSVSRVLGENLNRFVSASVNHELRSVMPEAVNRALLQPELISRLSDSMIQPLTQAVEREFSHSLHTTIIPSFQKLAIETAQKTLVEVERKHNDAINAFEQAQRNDSRKIDQLMATVKQMAETMSTMAKNQADFQEQVRQAQAEYYEHSPQVQAQTQVLEPERTPEQREAEEIENLLRSGKYEDGTIKVSLPPPSTRQTKVFSR